MLMTRNVLQRRRLGRTRLEVHPLCLGGNVFGWTADEESSFAVLDAYVAAGGNFIDTADMYMQSIDGLSGGESESVIGRWLRERGNREQLVIATKVAKYRRRPGLSAENIHLALDESLARLQTDYVDLYYAHEDDVTVPVEETLGAFDAVVRAGKVRHIGASNFAAPRLAEALEVSARHGWARYEVLQPRLNLVDRTGYGADLAAVCANHNISCVPFFGLAQGFLTGKYRPGGPAVASARAGGASKHLDGRGVAVLEALDDVAERHAMPVAAIALAWLSAQPTVAAPIASARSTAQLTELLPMAQLELDEAELALLDRAARV
jgi:aryl-alcohol dehydrogenase-like predicted oxidoreductase